MSNLPNALRVGGTPVQERSNSSFSDRPGPRQRTSSDRMSQLFPSRRESTVSSIHEEDIPRRTSYPSPINSGTNESVFTLPQVPTPPSFSSDTAYDPHSDLVSPISSAGGLKTSRSRSILNSFGSMSNRLSRNSRYGRLDGEESDIGVRKTPSRALGNVQEEDDGDHVGFDISGFDGPSYSLQHMHASSHSKSPVSAPLKPVDSVEAGLAAEFERLEAQSKVEEKYGLGSGMRSIMHAPFVASKFDKSIPVLDQETVQKEADQKGAIVAVDEMPSMDISFAEGSSEWEASNGLRNGAEGETHTSYIFPKDENKPNWQPFSMKWPYLLVLIVLALSLSVLQEFLCQVSLRREDGILHFSNAQDVSVRDYFTWKYAPTMVLVTYGVMWQITDFEVKRLEPYFQLSTSNGATAAESLNIDYLTFTSYLTPLKAIKYGQWAVAFSSLSTLLASSLVPVLQSASLTLQQNQPSDEDQVGLKIVKINPIWSRILSVALLLVAISGTSLLFQLNRRKSGLLSDPRGIAGIAAMATRSHILQDFHGLDRADEATIHKQLKTRRYVLHESTIWQGKYIANGGRVNEQKVSKKPQLNMLTLKAGIPYILFIFAVMVLVPIVLFVPGTSMLTVKVPFILTALATCIKFIWNTLDGDVRLVEPYFILSRRHAPPRTLTLDYTGTPPGWIILKAALNKHYLVALVGLGSVLAEVLTVCMTSFAVDGKQFLTSLSDKLKDIHDSQGIGGAPNNNTDETFASFWVSFLLSLLILAYLIIIACYTYALRRHKFLPRPPGTIASVLAYIHRSNMLGDFVGTQKMDSKAMTKHLESKGKEYGLGWFWSGIDRAHHCGVDEEPLLAGFEWGKDWTMGRMTGPMAEGY